MARVLSPSILGSDVVRKQRAFTKNDLIKTKFLIRLLFLVAFMAILSLFYIWSRVQIVQYGYEINELRDNQSHLVEANHRLKVEVATLRSPKRIESLAKEKLKMVPLISDQLKTIDE